MSKKYFQILILVALVLASFAGVSNAAALSGSGCGSTYYVQRGDTLYRIAANCGTTMDAIREANPGVYTTIYAGQVLRMPDGSQNDYNNNHGQDGGWNQGNNNGQNGGWNGGSCYVVQRGDTLKNIASRYDTTWTELARLNNIYNYNLIYAGQCLRVPDGSNYHQQPGSQSNDYCGYCSDYYTVRRGDTLRIIANQYDTTVWSLQRLNPNIWNPNIIYAGMVIRVR
jgi:lysozyme